MDERALICAAQITLRRAILENFPPEPERDKRLEWLARAVSSRLDAWRALTGPFTSGTQPQVVEIPTSCRT
jgi:hypothetical protein